MAVLLVLTTGAHSGLTDTLIWWLNLVTCLNAILFYDQTITVINLTMDQEND